MSECWFYDTQLKKKINKMKNFIILVNDILFFGLGLFLIEGSLKN